MYDWIEATDWLTCMTIEMPHTSIHVRLDSGHILAYIYDWIEATN